MAETVQTLFNSSSEVAPINGAPSLATSPLS